MRPATAPLAKENPPARLRLGLGLSAFYATYCSTLGVALPFWPVWLEGRGLDASAIGLVLAVELWSRALGKPVFGWLADRFRPRPLLILLPVAALIAYGAFAVAPPHLLLYCGLSAGLGASFFALMPVGETVALQAVNGHGLEYGRLRLWGSLGFIVSSVGVGHVLTGTDPKWVLPTIVLCVGLTLGAGATIPALPRPVLPPTDRVRARTVLTRPSFLLLVVAACAVQASHATYYGFSALHWRQAGHSEFIVGLLWAEGVASEILLFRFGTRITERFQPATLIALGGLAGVVRWSVLAGTTDLTALALSQTLHALTFGATHLGAMEYLRRFIPPHLTATATSVYGAALAGPAFGIAMPIAGVLVDAGGDARAFGFAAVLSTIGLGTARFLGRSTG